MWRDRARARWVAPLLVGLLCVVVYNANLRTISSGDSLSARYQPLILWHDGTVALEGNERLVAHGHPVRRPSSEADARGQLAPRAYWMIESARGQRVSLYPGVTPLLVAPLYLPAALYLEHDGWRQPKVDRVAEAMEKLSASILASLATVIVFLVLRRERNRWALPLALVFALGTSTWTTSSQALWQHGVGELLVALALLLGLARASPARMATLGSVCVLMVANRPPDALIACAFGLFVLWTRRHPGWLIAGALPAAAVVLYYNLVVLGSLAGGYGLAADSGQEFFGFDALGLPGLLFSPTRGLLVFAPFLVFVVAGFRQRIKDPQTKPLAIALGLGVVAQLAFYSQADWRAGASYGPRWLTDLLPILIWMLAPALLVMRPLVKRAFVATAVFAIAVQAVGAFWYTGVSNDRILGADRSAMKRVWSPANTPFVVELGHRPAAPDLLCGAGGSIDDVSILRSGALVQGWALACRRTPAQVLLLINGRIVGAATHFVARPDVKQDTGIDASAGWRVIADTHRVPPGRHVLQLAVRHTPRSDLRIVHEKTVRVEAAPQLDTVAGRAAQRIVTAQSPAGYWTTSFTDAPTFGGSRIEMNTFLTSMMVDLMSPIAAEHGLAPAVERGRRHLQQQIEPNGLVRFHGLPDGPGIGTLGCVITPDADDTALAWRIAGLDTADPRAGEMLGTLARYRDARGLYRTWLAQRNDYQCLDPGRVANPADIGIQMHVYLMLRRLDPPAARRLCSAMRDALPKADSWVYYARAPLVPYLRAHELGSMGCRLPIRATDLTSRQADGQEIWSELTIRLASAAREPGSIDRDGARRLLERLSVNDFAAIRTTPPLLYHNDMSAKVRRFYWSEDAGYALWLRLYEASR